MKKRLVSALLVCVMVFALSGVASAATYDDTQGHWGASSIERWSEYDIVSGTGTGFSPNRQITRGEAAKVFANLLKLDTSVSGSYADVPASAWYAGPIAACAEAGIMKGVGANKMDPNGYLTREQMFTMFCRALHIEPQTTEPAGYKDLSKCSPWAKGYVNAMINLGYIKGISATSVAPGNDINRASMMVMLDRAISTYANENGSTVEVTKSNGIVLVVADNVTVTGSANATIVVAAEKANVSLDGYTGTATVNVIANDVAITDAPAGTTVAAAENVTGITANGSDVAADDSIVIGGSTSSYVPPYTPPTKPAITIGDKKYEWDPDEKEYFYTDDNEEKVFVTMEDVKEAIGHGTITVDGKEYTYDSAEAEWVAPDGSTTTLESLLGGTSDFEAVP